MEATEAGVCPYYPLRGMMSEHSRQAHDLILVYNRVLIDEGKYK
jgi:hypothetical protein